MRWKRYVELEPVKRLKNEGREFLGNVLCVTEKRDGSNISMWLQKTPVEGESGWGIDVKISSHNLENADEKLIERFKSTPEYTKAIDLLNDECYYGKEYILYGELLYTTSPTRIEPRRKHLHWILFDIYDTREAHFLTYNEIYQKAYHFKIPIVRLLDEFTPLSLKDVEVKAEEWLKWCKRHRREGIVLKCYGNQTFAKEKIDLPKKPKLDKPQKNEIQYPPMPEERILRALQHAYDELGSDEAWGDRARAMPVIARHFEAEAKEHLFSTPKNMYNIYCSYDLAIIRGSRV